jgi:rhodanese-related sulfurtransferase
LDPASAHQRRAEIQFLDVRTPPEWHAGHVEGARHIPVDHLPGREDELDRSRPVVVVCQVGLRSDMAALFLRSRGFDAQNLEGGLQAWCDQEFPLVTSDGQKGRIIDPLWPPITPCSVTEGPLSHKMSAKTQIKIS